MARESLLTREDLIGSLFFPHRVVRPPPPHARDVFIEVDGARLHVRVHGEASKPLVLLFHGNGETVADWDGLAAGFTPLVQVAIADYRGYGQSTGVPTMQRVFDDALAVFDELARTARVAPIVMGRSLGSAPAWHVAAHRHAQVRALVVDSGFTDVDAFARRRGVQPASLTATERAALDPLPKAARFDGPVLVLHGVDDTVITLDDAERVLTALPGARFVSIPARGHNDVLDSPMWWEALTAWLDEVSPSPLLALTLARAPLHGYRVVVDIDGKTTFHDTPTLAEARAYAADVRLESAAPDRTLAIVFDPRGWKLEG